VGEPIRGRPHLLGRMGSAIIDEEGIGGVGEGRGAAHGTGGYRSPRNRPATGERLGWTPSVPSHQGLAIMIDDISRIAADARTRIAAAATLDELAATQRELLGRGSELGGVKAQMGGLDHDQRRTVGAALNEATRSIQDAVAERRSTLETDAARERAEAERLDRTEVRAERDAGHLHLVTQTIEELEDVFVGLGFTVEEGREVEDDWHNFTALNFGEHHPARDMQDTFFVDLGEPQDV